MKRLTLLAAVATLIAMPAWAQTPKLPAQKKAETKSEANPPTKSIKPVYRHLTKRSRLDARECLKYQTNEEIIVCAEKFL